jgi:hypothetical protein
MTGLGRVLPLSRRSSLDEAAALRGLKAAKPVQRSQLNLLRDAERIVNLELRVPKQQLNCSQVACLLADLGWLCSPHRVGAIG